MSIASEITRLQTAKADIKTAIEAKGVSVPADATLSTYDDYVSQITGGGGGGVVKKDVNFYDYNGTLLHSYTLAEAQALEALPDLPTAPFDYTADSWTETLASVKALTKPFSIGVNYTTTRTGTEIDIEVPETDKTVYCSCYQSGNTVDWGDGTVDTVSADGDFISHTYDNSGNYTVTYGDSSNREIRFQQTKCLNPNTEEPQSYFVTSMLCQRDTLYLNGNGLTIHPSNLIKAVRFGSKVADGITSSYTCFPSQKLEYFILPKGTVTTLNRAFNGCSSLQSITIPSSVTSIGSNAFENCKSLQSITIPSSVTSIGSTAFKNCSSLQSITIPSSVTSIESTAFHSCSSLQNVTIPNGVTSIGGNAFNGCSSLQSLTIPDGVTSIGMDTFYNCTSLQSVTIPNGVTSIDYRTFKECSSLQSVTIGSGVTSIRSNAFENCFFLRSVTIPDGVTSIESYAFQECHSLQSVTIGSGVTHINYRTFYSCYSLHSVTIPDNVTYIGGDAFNSCRWLNEIHVEATTPPTLGSNVFMSNYSTRKIYVPYSADHSVLAAYKAANNWSAYADYIEEEPQA